MTMPPNTPGSTFSAGGTVTLPVNPACSTRAAVASSGVTK